VLNNHSQGRLKEDKASHKDGLLKFLWSRNDKDTGNFDLDFLLEYNKVLGKMGR
jgi:hypothetical protein